MSGVRILKIRRSAAAEEAENHPDPTAVPPVSEQAQPDRSGQLAPLEPPYDRQCIMRFPDDVAEKVHQILKSKGTTDTTEVVRISVDNELLDGVDFRLFTVRVFEHQHHLKQFDMRGVLVDLPTFVESYKTVNNGTTITKSSDVSQMMICFKRAEFNLKNPSSALQKALNLVYPSGLTPPTNDIRNRKFRPQPSQEEIQNIRSAEDLVENVMSGGALEWVVETEVDEDEAVQRSINEPENVWTPTEDILNQLRKAGYIDENGELVHTASDDEDDDDDQSMEQNSA